MCRPAVRVRGHAGGGGVPGLAFGPVPPHVGGGGRGSKRSAPLFPGPQGEPAHDLHPRFVVAEIWADRGQFGGGGGRPGGGGPKVGGPARDPLLRMRDLHFATNNICMAPRLANLALKTWMV